MQLNASSFSTVVWIAVFYNKDLETGFMCKLIVVVYEICYFLESNLLLFQIASSLSLLIHHIFQLFQRPSLKKSYF